MSSWDMEDELEEINPAIEGSNGSKGGMNDNFNALTEPNDPAMGPTNDEITAENIPGVPFEEI